MTPDLSIIIVSWNVREHLERCLSSLSGDHGITLEVIVIDNASGDGSVASVAEKFPWVHCIANRRNAGFAHANNQGIAVASGRVILLLNPDTLVREGSLKTTVDYLLAHQDVGIIGAHILNPDGTLQKSVRRFPTLLSQILVLLKLHVLMPKLSPIRSYNADDFSYDAEADVDQVMGAYLAFRRELCSTVGTLDEGYHLWFEEVDFCLRVHKAGLRVRYLPQVVITHFGGESFRQLLSVEQQLIFNKSLLGYFHKHHSAAAFTVLAVLYPVSIGLALIEQLIRR